MQEYEVERYFRDAKVAGVFDGTQITKKISLHLSW